MQLKVCFSFGLKEAESQIEGGSLSNSGALSGSRSQVQMPLESRPVTEQKGSGKSWGRPGRPVLSS